MHMRVLDGIVYIYGRPCKACEPVGLRQCAMVVLFTLCLFGKAREAREGL